MALTIKHNGKDITAGVELSRCLLYDRYGGMLDSLSLEFPEGITKFDFYRYDEIEVTGDTYKSGTMYIDECEFSSGKYSINAISFKQKNKQKRSGIWKNVKLLQIAKDIAKECGLELKTYGVTDFTYEALSRVDETGLQFLSRICRREGYSIKCDNGKLIIFNNRMIENDATPLELKPTDIDPSYWFKRQTNGLSNVTLRFYNQQTGLIEHSATDEDVDGGTEVITERVKDLSEALRFATGRLRQANENYIVGQIKMDFSPATSAGTVLLMKEFGEFSGKYVVYEAVHDIVNEKTYLKIRGTLKY